MSRTLALSRILEEDQQNIRVGASTIPANMSRVWFIVHHAATGEKKGINLFVNSRVRKPNPHA